MQTNKLELEYNCAGLSLDKTMNTLIQIIKRDDPKGRLHLIEMVIAKVTAVQNLDVILLPEDIRERVQHLFDHITEEIEFGDYTRSEAHELLGIVTSAVSNLMSIMDERLNDNHR